MSAPSHDDDQLKLEIFDSFSKTVMRNASRNFAAAAKTRRKNESVNTDIVQYILKTHGENAVYPSEHFIDAGNGYCCVVATEWLYQAMLLLPPKQKEVDAGNDLIATCETAGYPIVLQAVNTGRISENRVNESVIRILAYKLYYGLMS